jgi:hypothetical protein
MSPRFAEASSLDTPSRDSRLAHMWWPIQFLSKARHGESILCFGELWTLLHMVEPGWFPTKSKFLELYARTFFNAYGGQEVTGVKPENSDELHKIVDPLMRRVHYHHVVGAHHPHQQAVVQPQHAGGLRPHIHAPGNFPLGQVNRHQRAGRPAVAGLDALPFP